MRRTFLLTLFALALFAAAQAWGQSARPAVISAVSVPKPHIVWKPIPFGAKRKAEMAAYARRHYGINSWRLQQPHVIVEHYTVSSTFSSA